jgi:hypothetical protein
VLALVGLTNLVFGSRMPGLLLNIRQLCDGDHTGATAVGLAGAWAATGAAQCPGVGNAIALKIHKNCNA